MTSWITLSEIIGHELQRLMTDEPEWVGGQDLLPDDESAEAAVRGLIRLDAETRDELDRAVETFLADSAWPELSVPSRYMLSQRLFCALDLLYVLSLPSAGPLLSPDSAEEPEWLKWLLVITWRTRAEQWLTVKGHHLATTPAGVIS